MRSDHLLVSLKVLGSLQEGQKISGRCGLISIDTRPSSIKRWFSGDSRYVTLLYITTIIHEALILGTMQKELIEAKPGIATLKITYCTDISFTATIDILLNKINTSNIK